MNCNCTTEVAKSIQEKYPGEYEDLRCKNMMFSFTTGKSSLGIPFTYRKRNSKTKEMYQKSYDIPVAISFCPFCGKSTKKEEVSDENS